MKTWTKATCLALCAGLLVSGVAAGLAHRGDPQDDLKKAKEDAKKQLDEMLKKKQQPGGPAKEGKPADAQDPMMAMMMELSKPVAEHDIIKNFAGSWNADVKMWMDPTQKEPTHSTGTMKGTPLHGGRYVLGQYTGDFAGMAFSGTMMWAYNRIESRYESTWMDSFGTGIMMLTGKATADGKTIESTGSFRMPGPDGKLMDITQREKIVMLSKDKYFMEMWHATKEQGEAKVMEITYTRAADGAKPAAAPTAPGGPGITMPPTTR